LVSRSWWLDIFENAHTGFWLMFLACIFFGIVPMVIYAMIAWRLDRWEKVPVSLLIAGRSRWKIRSC